MAYNAFVSYSHNADALIAPALQTGLERLTKQWWRRRALHVFCDTTALSANPALWSAITAAMQESEYLVLLASPESTRSPWVGREIEHWRATKPSGTILQVLTAGELIWDDAAGDFDRERSTALHPALAGAFAEEPLYVDMRFARSNEDLSLDNPAFFAAVADLAAPIHGVPKDEIVGEDLRQHRRTRRVTWAAALALAFLAIATLAGAAIALDKAAEAKRKADEVIGANASAASARHSASLAKGSAASAKRAEERSKSAAEQAKQKSRDADRKRIRAIAATNAAKQEASSSRATAAKKQAEAIVAGEEARRQQSLAAAAAIDRDQAQLARDQATLERDQANSDADQARLARDQANVARDQANLAEKAARARAQSAIDTANDAIDAANTAKQAAASAAAAAKTTGLAAAAQRTDLLDSSLDLALLLANESSYVETPTVAKIPPEPGIAAQPQVSGGPSPAHPSAAARGALLTTTQTAAGLLHHLQFPGHAGPQSFSHIAASSGRGGRVAASETSNDIQVGRRSSRLYVWRNSRNPADRAIDLSKRLPFGDRLGCINELDWDASGRYLLSVEDSRGCLNPQAIHGLPGLYARTIRLWDLDVPPGTSAAPTTVRNAISRLGYSPVTIDPTGSVFLFQLPGGVVRFDINHQDQAQALYGFYLASTLFDGTNISPRGTYVVGAQLNLAGTELHAAVSRMDGTGPVSVLADPAARLSFAFDPLERVVAAVVPGTGVEFFDPADGHERIELRRSISPDPSDLVLGRPLDGSGNRVDRAFVSHCSNADCTGATTVSSFDWSDPAAQPEQLAVVDKPLVGVTDVSPGGRYLTVEWYAPHELDHGFTLNTLVLDPLTGATLQDVFGRVAMFSAPDERFVVGQEIDAQLNATDQRLTVRAGVWDLGLPGGATAGTGTLVLSETNVEVTPAPDRRSVAVFPTSYPVTASQDQPVAIWTLDESATDPVARTLPGTKGTAHSVAFDGAGHLVGIGETASALLWDVAGRPYETLDLEAPTAVLRTATNRDATMRALTRDGTTLILRHLDPAHHAHTDVNGPALPLVGAEQIDWLSFSPDGSLLFVNFHDPSKENSAQRHYPSGSVVVTIATGAVSRRFPEELVTSSGDGTRLAFRERNAADPLRTNGIVVRTAADLKDEWRVDVSALPEDDVAAASSVYALDWHGGKLAGTNSSAKAVVWSRGDPGYRRFDPGSEAVARVAFFGVAFSPDGTRLALTTPDRRVRLYDLTTPATEPKVVQRLSPFAGGRVKFSDDGEMLLVDGIYLMDGHSLELIGSRLHPDEWNDPSKDLGTNATFFTRDGQYVVAERGDDSQSVRWAVGVETLRTRACSIAARNLTRDEAEQFRLGSKSLSRCPFPVAGG